MTYTSANLPTVFKILPSYWINTDKANKEKNTYTMRRKADGKSIDLDNRDGGSTTFYSVEHTCNLLNNGNWIFIPIEEFKIQPFMRVIYAEDVYIVVKIEGEIFYGVREDGNSWPMKLESIVAAYNPPDDARDYLSTEEVGELIYVTEELIAQSKEELQAYTEEAIQLEHEFEIARKNLDNAKNRHNEIMEAAERMER